MQRYLKYLFILIFASISLTINPLLNKKGKETEALNFNYYQLGYNDEDIAYLKTIFTESQIHSIFDLNVTRDNLFKYLEIETFSVNDIKNIENLRIKNNLSHLAAVNLSNHPYLMNHFYEKIQKAVNTDNHLILVNKNYQLDQDYIPPNLVYANDIRQLVDEPSRYFLQSEAYLALKALFQEAEKHGYKLFLSNGYRSYQRQEQIYHQYLLDGYNADVFSARPGHSEHQTGLAVDITCKSANYELSEKFADTLEGQFIKHNAHRYGFIERYPKTKEHLTGYTYEPWHLRYVGVKAASIIYHENLTLEEYLINYTVIPK